jgi:hypothetical protein
VKKPRLDAPAGPDGTFQVSLPPGTYDVWATAPDHEEATFRLEVAADETEVFVIQRPELTRLRNLDGDGVAEVRTNVADNWGITGSHHGFTYGSVRERAGNFYASSGHCSFGRGVELPWTRGPLRTARSPRKPRASVSTLALG